jgi:hypothetical protein
MKRILLFCIIFSITQLTSLKAQKGYFSIGATSLTNKGFNPGFTFGGGYIQNNFGVGVMGDFWGIGRKKEDFAVVSFDLRAYLTGNSISPYFSLQPGVVLYEKSIYGVQMKGHLAGSVLLGLDANFKEDRPGLNLFVGYQYVSFKVDKDILSSGNYFKSGITFVLN